MGSRPRPHALVPEKRALMSIATALFFGLANVTAAPDAKPMPVIFEPTVVTAHMGGVAVPSGEALESMHAGQYILRAYGGKLTRVPVVKTLLPHCPKVGVQGVQVDLGPGETIYSRQRTMLCKSTDGGRTWASQPISAPAGWTIPETGRWKVLRDGTLVCVAVKMGRDQRAPAEVWVSGDEGRSWTKRAEIPVEMKLPQSGKRYAERYCHRGLDRLEDNTLLWVVDIRDDPYTEGHGAFCFRSTDAGRTWQGPVLMIDWGSEGAAVRLPSGRVLATMRYQRQPAPSDTAEMRTFMGTHPGRTGLDGFKNVFLMDSDDGGRSWSPPRMLTTVFGQTFGYPAVQSDGTVVVVHDTRYGPGHPGARALISRDEGKTWEDEVYYLDHTRITGSYSASVVLGDDTIVTICASSRVTHAVAQAGQRAEGGDARTDLHAIRWKPVKR